MLEEATVTCPACWESIQLDIDISAGSAVYTEDCPVCCRPMTVHVRVNEDEACFEVEVEPESD